MIARVGGRELRLKDLVAHVTDRHDPTFAEFLATDSGARTLRSPLTARWVRQFADVVALEIQARNLGVDRKRTDECLSAALKRGFEDWLVAYNEERAKAGSHEDLTQDRVNLLLARYQQEFGLETEVRGWLDALVPGEFNEGQVALYFNTYNREMNGHVTFAHILIHHRDPATGELLDADGQRRAQEKVADVKARLKADGSNFADVAQLLSDDRRTAAKGGVFEQVGRFDPRLPVELCRTAWGLKDGDWTGPVASPYGLHFVKRLSFLQTQFVLYAESVKPRVREVMRQHRQEDVLFEVRQQLEVKLEY